MQGVWGRRVKRHGRWGKRDMQQSPTPIKGFFDSKDFHMNFGRSKSFRFFSNGDCLICRIEHYMIFPKRFLELHVIGNLPFTPTSLYKSFCFSSSGIRQTLEQKKSGL
jgi:hypothetical protein